MDKDVDIIKKKRKLSIYYGLLVTVICIIGVSFAWFRLYLSQTENNTLASRTCFNTTLTEDTSKISLTDAFPITDEDGLKQTPFTFKIKNNCNSYVKVYITIDSTYRESTSTSYLKDNYMKVNISPKGTTTSKSVILGSQTLTDLENNKKGYIIVSTGLKANEEKSYDLRIWIDSSVTTEQGLNKTWSGKIVVVSNATEEPAPAPNGWYEAGSGTLLASLRDSNTLKTPITTPGAAISTASEALLASAEDNNGTSYYFRGAVKNNYVQFANKCWRIVRVGGDGSVKLILHNDNTTGAANPCDAANNSASAAFARYSGTTYKSAFNTNYNDNAYVGFKYGTAGASDYATTHANTNNSTILTNLETWYNNNLKTYADAIADTVWCNDKTNVEDKTYNPWSYGGNATGLGYGTNKTYYGATQRLVSTSGSAGGTGPSLKCNGELSKINSKVGLITADELAFAGYAYNISNTTTYLQENATDTYWWSLSPYSFDGGDARVWYVGGSSGDFGSYYVDFTIGVRPSISLKSTTNVTGEGTSSTPYIISM
jgi:hypothetical protein